MNMKKRICTLVLAIVMMLNVVAAQAATLSTAEVDKINSLVASLVTENTSAYKRAKVLHDWLINNANYDYTYTYYYPNGVLLEGTGVCQSYALAYEQLTRAAGLESIYLVGESINHGWNMVKIDDEWFHVDCTWDDPGQGGYERDDYFLMSDADIVGDHIEWYASDRYREGYGKTPPTADSDTYDTVDANDSASSVYMGTFADLQTKLYALAAAGDWSSRLFKCSYDGSDAQYAAIKQWAWYTNHPGFEINTLWRASDWIQMEVFWDGVSDYVYFAKSALFLDPGDSEAIVVDDVSNNNLVWTSSDPSVATVDQYGNVTAQQVGEAIITATVNGTSARDTLRVKVLPPMQADFNLTFTRVSGTEGTLTWKEIPGVTEYRLFVMASGQNDYTHVATTTKLKASVKLEAGKQYRFYVYAMRIANGDIIASHKSLPVGDLRDYSESEFSAVYNYEYYIANNQDIVRAYGADRAILLNHFVNNGMAEGRPSHPDFNVSYYIANNPDLQGVFGGDLKSYYLHYQNNGRFEGRVANVLVAPPKPSIEELEAAYSHVYNFNYYSANNPDVAAVFGGDRAAIFEHFVNSGMAEGRPSHSGFNVSYYIANNADLQAVFGGNLKEYYLHFQNNGKAEGRVADRLLPPPEPPKPSIEEREAAYSSVYSFSYYSANHPDVAAAFGGDRTAIFEHFLSNGMAEGRRASSGFSVEYYMANYPDLKAAFGNNLKAYYLHYQSSGKAEGRIANTLIAQEDPNSKPDSREARYAPVYDYEYYLAHNPDVAAAFGGNRTETMSHFINSGMAEGRRGSSEFSVHAYRANYPDLEAAFGGDLKDYYMHYINNGKAEGRSGN